MDLIDREETLKAMDTWDKFGCDENCRLIPLRETDESSYVPYVHYEDMVKAVKGMPSEQKTGKWINCKYPLGECSECHAIVDIQNNEANYCPVCGSRNRGEAE